MLLISSYFKDGWAVHALEGLRCSYAQLVDSHFKWIYAVVLKLVTIDCDVNQFPISLLLRCRFPCIICTHSFLAVLFAAGRFDTAIHQRHEAVWWDFGWWQSSLRHQRQVGEAIVIDIAICLVLCLALCLFTAECMGSNPSICCVSTCSCSNFGRYCQLSSYKHLNSIFLKPVGQTWTSPHRFDRWSVQYKMRTTFRV